MALIPDDYVNQVFLEPNMSFEISMTVYPGTPGEQYIKVVGGGKEYQVSNGVGQPVTLKIDTEVNTTDTFQQWSFQSGTKHLTEGGTFEENFCQYMFGWNGFGIKLFMSFGADRNPVGEINFAGIRHQK